MFSAVKDKFISWGPITGMVEVDAKCIGTFLIHRPTLYVRVSPGQVYGEAFSLDMLRRHGAMLLYGLRLYGITIKNMTPDAKAHIMRAAYLVMHVVHGHVENVTNKGDRYMLRVWARWYVKTRRKLTALPSCSGERPGDAHIRALCNMRAPILVDFEHSACGNYTDWGAWLRPDFWESTAT